MILFFNFILLAFKCYFMKKRLDRCDDCKAVRLKHRYATGNDELLNSANRGELNSHGQLVGFNQHPPVVGPNNL